MAHPAVVGNASSSTARYSHSPRSTRFVPLFPLAALSLPDPPALALEPSAACTGRWARMTLMAWTWPTASWQTTYAHSASPSQVKAYVSEHVWEQGARHSMAQHSTAWRALQIAALSGHRDHGVSFLVVRLSSQVARQAVLVSCSCCVCWSPAASMDG